MTVTTTAMTISPMMIFAMPAPPFVWRNAPERFRMERGAPSRAA